MTRTVWFINDVTQTRSADGCCAERRHAALLFLRILPRCNSRFCDMLTFTCNMLAGLLFSNSRMTTIARCSAALL